MRKRIDPSTMIGQTFGSWTVLDYAGRNKSGHDQYLCRCVCGTERTVDFPSLRKGLSKSCGCGMRCVDLTGQTFGRWTVLETAGRNKLGQDQYLCRCECGTERVVAGPRLRNGTSKSCGCGKRRFDLTGQTFGRWTVIKDAGQDKRGHDQYLCRCACGTERVVKGPALRRGTSASCGCKRGKSTKRVTDDAVIGQKFGSWEVLKRAENTKKGSRLFLCRCQCGTERLVTLHNLTTGKSKSCGCGRFVNKSDTDLTGQEFGYWKVLGPVETSGYGTKRYRCRCQCGKEEELTEAALLKGRYKSCGCMKNDRGSKYDDLIGQRFGAWTVLERDETVDKKNKFFKCRCVCGTERSVRARNLIDGRSKSCGCLSHLNWKNLTGTTFGSWTVIEQKEPDSEGKRPCVCRCECGKKRTIDKTDLIYGVFPVCSCKKQPKTPPDSELIGKKFGDWTVLSPTGRLKTGGRVFLCRCVCGQERAIDLYALRHGKSKGCGCRSRIKDLTGQTFGSWTVLNYTGKDKHGGAQFLCRCVCGTERVVTGARLVHGGSQSCGCRGTGVNSSEIDLTGQQFGFWTVLGLTERDRNLNKRYLCRCVCGNERAVLAYNLVSGISKSCGCMSKKLKLLDT